MLSGSCELWMEKKYTLTGRCSVYLVLGFEHQQVGDVSERHAEADHLRLCDVAGKLTDVDDPGWHAGTSYVTFELFAVVAIGYRGEETVFY